jgi:hypothetical protein
MDARSLARPTSDYVLRPKRPADGVAGLRSARYLGKYGSENVSKAVSLSGVPPYLLKTPDNPEGVNKSVFTGIETAIKADRYAFFTESFKNFYNTDVLMGKRISEQSVQASWNVAVRSSATASFECVTIQEFQSGRNFLVSGRGPGHDPICLHENVAHLVGLQ